MGWSIHKSLYNKLKAEIAMITGQRYGNIGDLRYWYQNITFQSRDELDETGERILYCSECEESLIPKQAGHLPEHKEDCVIKKQWESLRR